MRLALNIDHIATIREARKAREPEPLAAALIAEMAGAQGITVHLRTDRRHIKERDLELRGSEMEIAAARRSGDHRGADTMALMLAQRRGEIELARRRREPSAYEVEQRGRPATKERSRRKATGTGGRTS